MQVGNKSAWVERFFLDFRRTGNTEWKDYVENNSVRVSEFGLLTAPHKSRMEREGILIFIVTKLNFFTWRERQTDRVRERD